MFLYSKNMIKALAAGMIMISVTRNVEARFKLPGELRELAALREFFEKFVNKIANFYEKNHIGCMDKSEITGPLVKEVTEEVQDEIRKKSDQVSGMVKEVSETECLNRHILVAVVGKK